MNYEKFFDDHIPKSHMPSDYGGDLDSIKVLHNQHRENLMKMREYFLVEERQVKGCYDEWAEYSNGISEKGDDDDDIYIGTNL